MYSNFITPPDYIEEDKHTVLLIDATAEDVQRLALLCKEGTADFNIYLYQTGDDADWLNQVIDRSNAIIVNTFADENSELKEFLQLQPHTYFYGYNKTIESVQKYFIDYILNVRQHGTNTTL